eukprot:TRINITY_DN607_c0_g1_i1.p1 TRINITY_DN607_c0_g1~~TRINITY_DN607_c0_g1_i1.p1  ORF type:complete len:978 (+),score=109.54 TRINITY_DN607_c0_g1_i1:2-2935(+)
MSFDLKETWNLTCPESKAITSSIFPIYTKINDDALVQRLFVIKTFRCGRIIIEPLIKESSDELEILFEGKCLRQSSASKECQHFPSPIVNVTKINSGISGNSNFIFEDLSGCLSLYTILPVSDHITLQATDHIKLSNLFHIIKPFGKCPTFKEKNEEYIDTVLLLGEKQIISYDIISKQGRLVWRHNFRLFFSQSVVGIKVDSVTCDLLVYMSDDSWCVHSYINGEFRRNLHLSDKVEHLVDGNGFESSENEYTDFEICFSGVDGNSKENDSECPLISSSEAQVSHADAQPRNEMRSVRSSCKLSDAKVDPHPKIPSKFHRQTSLDVALNETQEPDQSEAKFPHFHTTKSFLQESIDFDPFAHFDLYNTKLGEPEAEAKSMHGLLSVLNSKMSVESIANLPKFPSSQTLLDYPSDNLLHVEMVLKNNQCDFNFLSNTSKCKNPFLTIRSFPSVHYQSQTQLTTQPHEIIVSHEKISKIFVLKEFHQFLSDCLLEGNPPKIHSLKTEMFALTSKFLCQSLICNGILSPSFDCYKSPLVISEVGIENNFNKTIARVNLISKLLLLAESIKSCAKVVVYSSNLLFNLVQEKVSYDLGLLIRMCLFANPGISKTAMFILKEHLTSGNDDQLHLWINQIKKIGVSKQVAVSESKDIIISEIFLNSSEILLLAGLFLAKFPEEFAKNSRFIIKALVTKFLHKLVSDEPTQIALKRRIDLLIMQLLGEGANANFFRLYISNANINACFQQIVTNLQSGMNQQNSFIALISKIPQEFLSWMNSCLFGTVQFKTLEFLLHMLYRAIELNKEKFIQSLRLVVDILLKCLNPANRTKLQTPASLVLKLIVAKLPVAFCGASQRLAVVDYFKNEIVVCDLRTCANTRTISMGDKVASCLCFSDNTIVAYSPETNGENPQKAVVSVFSLRKSIFSFSGKNIKTQELPPSSVLEKLSLMQKIEKTSISFGKDKRCVQITREDSSLAVIPVK